MAIQRSMNVADELSGILNEKQIDALIDAGLSEIEWDVDILSFTPGRPATMYQLNGDPGDPAEPAEYKTDMDPNEVAIMIIKQIEKIANLTPTGRVLCATKIYETESDWQETNMDEAVANEMEDE